MTVSGATVLSSVALLKLASAWRMERNRLGVASTYSSEKSLPSGPTPLHRPSRNWSWEQLDSLNMVVAAERLQATARPGAAEVRRAAAKLKCMFPSPKVEVAVTPPV